jgi:penicillin-binding protein 1A
LLFLHLNLVKKNPLKNIKPKAKKQVAKNGKSMAANPNERVLSKKTKWRVILLLWITALVIYMVVSALIYFRSEESLPSIEQLENPRSDEASLLYSSDGEILGSFYIANRTKVDFDELSLHLIDALVSTEDERYFEHSGIDGEALARAIGKGLLGMNAGGGSTITQQLAKMMFHKRPKTKWERIDQKLNEWTIAARLEKRYTKEEIIAMYFNEFDFLNTAVGIHAAARVYFNKQAHELNAQESAMLVGMAKNPTIYNPVRKPENTLKRREVVLSQMMRNDKISQVEYDSLRILPLGLDYNPETHTSGLAPYFREYVRIEAKRILKQYQIMNEYGKPIDIYRDGVKIYTSLDSRIQKHAEWAVEEHLGGELQAAFDKNIKKYNHNPYSNEVTKVARDNSLNRAIHSSERYRKLKEQGLSEAAIRENFKKKITMEVFDWSSENYRKEVEFSPIDSIYHYKSMLQVGLVSIEPSSGYIKAWVGGPYYKDFKYDHVYKAKRQVGSTMKPFIYAAALQDKVITPCTEFPDIKYCVDIPYGSATQQWCPSGQKTYGQQLTPVYFALANSMNNITAKIIAMSGGDNHRVVGYFQNMGINNKTIEAVASLGLGVCDMSVLEMTSAHCALSNLGYYNEPTAIIRIEDKNGKVLYEAQPKVRQIIQDEAAYEVIKMMKGVTGVIRPADGVKGGTAARLRTGKPYAFSGIMAGKTGTTQNNSDGWFMGHTPDLVTGIWVGAEDRGVHFSTTTLGQGANTALPIWGYYMDKVYKDKKIKISHGDFTSPYEGYPKAIECKTSGTFNDNEWID